MKTLFKKAGIVAAATTAGLLALSPLAFADESHGSDGSVSIDDSQVNECSATQTNAPLSIANVNSLLQCTNAANQDNVQITVLGSNTNG